MAGSAFAVPPGDNWRLRSLSLVVLVALLSTIVTHPPVFLSFVNWELFRGVI
jgi:hypothetical protein